MKSSASIRIENMQPSLGAMRSFASQIGTSFLWKIFFPQNILRYSVIQCILEFCTNDDVASIIDEAVLMSEFNHPHVLTLTGVAIDKEFGLPILVMPFMPNGDLNSYLRRFRYDPDFFDQVISVNLVCAPSRFFINF